MEVTDDDVELPRLRDHAVGTDTAVICDGCNRSIVTRPVTRHHGLDDMGPGAGDSEPAQVYLYATKRDGIWRSRFVTCEECGPIADTQTAEPDEVVASVTVTYYDDLGHKPFRVATAKLAPEVKHLGLRYDLRNSHRP